MDVLVNRLIPAEAISNVGPSVPIPVSVKKDLHTFKNGLKTMTENERDHILAALEMSEWKIYGEGGAAEMLDINGSTLHSRMKKLGIEKKIGPR